MLLPDLKSKTLAQLQAAIVPTKRDALIILNDGSDKVTDEPVRKYRKDGQIESETQAVRDVETGAVVRGKTITWTYHEKENGAPVDTITIVKTDANGKEVSRKVIRHFVDGKQPEVSE